MVIATSLPNTNCAQSLVQATQNILHNAFYLAKQKAELSRKAYKKLIKDWGWEKEDKKYLKVAQTFEKFSPQDLAQIEPVTIFRLANQNKKYAPVIEQLLDISYITQQTVRELMKQERKPKPFQSEKPSIWRRTRDGRRYCQVPPIHDQETGVILQKMVDEEGLTAQQIIAESLALRKAMKEGRLQEVPITLGTEDIEVPSSECTKSDEFLDNETYEDNSTDESIVKTDDSGIKVDESVFSSEIIFNPTTTQEIVEFLSNELKVVVDNIDNFDGRQVKEVKKIIAQIVDFCNAQSIEEQWNTLEDVLKVKDG